MSLEKIRKKIIESSEEKYKIGAKNYFKEEIKLYGVRTPKVREISRAFFPSEKSKKEIFQLAEEMIKTGYMEESTIGFEWIYRKKKDWEKKDFKFFEKIVKKYIDNWAKCDDFCCHTLGEFLLEFPEFKKETKKWAKNKNRWERRASAVCLILPVRKKPKENLKDVFEISEILLEDKDDLVQKGYGWLLKVSADIERQKVFDWIMKRKNKMPRTALRYAIEKMPKEMKTKAME